MCWPFTERIFRLRICGSGVWDWKRGAAWLCWNIDNAFPVDSQGISLARDITAMAEAGANLLKKRLADASRPRERVFAKPERNDSNERTITMRKKKTAEVENCLHCQNF